MRSCQPPELESEDSAVALLSRVWDGLLYKMLELDPLRKVFQIKATLLIAQKEILLILKCENIQ